MSKKQKGFTLIELITIIVIAGILAVVAVPKYFDLTEQAAEATAKGVLGTLRSTNSLIFADRLVKNQPGGYTMQDIVDGAMINGINGLDEYEVDGNKFTLKVKGYNYTFTLTPAPVVPSQPGKIVASDPNW